MAAFVDSKLVAFSWSAFTQVKMNEELWVGFDWPYRYAYKAYTHPEHRGRGIIEAILYYAGSFFHPFSSALDTRCCLIFSCQ